MGVGEPEALLERVMPVRVLVREGEVGVVPRDPPRGAGQQRAVQHVPVVVAAFSSDAKSELTPNSSRITGLPNVPDSSQATAAA